MGAGGSRQPSLRVMEYAVSSPHLFCPPARPPDDRPAPTRRRNFKALYLFRQCVREVLNATRVRHERSWPGQPYVRLPEVGGDNARATSDPIGYGGLYDYLHVLLLPVWESRLEGPRPDGPVEAQSPSLADAAMEPSPRYVLAEGMPNCLAPRRLTAVDLCSQQGFLRSTGNVIAIMAYVDPDVGANVERTLCF
jgi:hypothetical protein